MINPNNPNHRQQLSRALDFAHQEIKKYNRLRATTIQAYLGITPDYGDTSWDARLGGHMSRTAWDRYKRNLPKGNLLQLAGLSHQIALAYGEPRFNVVARTPENAGLAEKLGPALNRMAALLDLGETHRGVAADSYFGYGIYKCAVGYLPEAARVATGLEVGPCVWKVAQNDFLYDITAKDWGRARYVGDMYTMALEDAQRMYPESADRLTAYTDADRMDAVRVLPRPSRFHAPEEDIWLVDIYFPAAKVVGTWPVRADSFGTITDEPLALRDFNGHWSGVYQVLTHLYSPDELVPIAQAESVKAIHFLFDDILQLTSEQARAAKINPVYPVAGEKDMQRLWRAKDRVPVSMTNFTNLPTPFEIPGPTPSQTQYLGALYNFFREFTPTYDDPAKAPTATQGALERQTTNAIVAEARRKDTRVLQLVGYKLGHLILNDQELRLPASRPLRPGSNVSLDVSFGPGPRAVRIDDLDISIVPESTIYRSSAEKVGQLVQSTRIITEAMTLAAQGAPINVEKVIRTLADAQDLPELLEWYEPADPLAESKRQSSRRSSPMMKPGGQYTRRNVSEKTNAGALMANLNGTPSENGQPPRVT